MKKLIPLFLKKVMIIVLLMIFLFSSMAGNIEKNKAAKVVTSSAVTTTFSAITTTSSAINGTIQTVQNISSSFNGEGLTDIKLTGTSVSGTVVTDIPVYCIRKGTATTKHQVLLFVGDGYTKDEQDDFINDVKAKTELFLKTIPINYFEDRFDVYAIEVPSNESGINKDTFFKTGGNITTGGRATAFKLRNALANKLGIHKDNDVYTTVMIANYSFGGGSSSSGGFYSAIGKGSHAVCIHEIGHSAHVLTDEYYMGAKVQGGAKKVNRIHISDIAKDGLSDLEIANLTMYDYDKLDVTKVRWSAYLGYKGVYIDGFDDDNNVSTTEFRPNHKTSMMGNAGQPFCAICEQEIFTQLNKKFGMPYSVFVPTPEFSYPLVENPTYYCNWASSQGKWKADKTYFPTPEAGKKAIGQPPAELKRFENLSTIDVTTNTNKNLKEAAKKDISFRTVVAAYGKAANLKLKLTILDENNQIKATREKDFAVNKVYSGSGYGTTIATSLELVLKQNEWEVITGTSTPDLSQYKVVGEVINNETGEVLQTTTKEAMPSPSPEPTTSVSPTEEVSPEPTTSVSPTEEASPEPTTSVSPTEEASPEPTTSVSPTKSPDPENGGSSGGSGGGLPSGSQKVSNDNQEKEEDNKEVKSSETPDNSVIARPTQIPETSETATKYAWKIDISANKVKAEKKKGYLYSLDGENWTQVATFKKLVPMKEYTLYVKNILSNKVIEQPFITYPKTITTETTIKIEDLNQYEYKIKNGKWTTTPVFKNLKPDKTYCILIRKINNHNKKSNKDYQFKIKTDSLIKKVTQNRIVVKKNIGYYYRINNGRWQKSNIFKGIDKNTIYKIEVKIDGKILKQKVRNNKI